MLVRKKYDHTDTFIECDYNVSDSVSPSCTFFTAFMISSHATTGSGAVCQGRKQIMQSTTLHLTQWSRCFFLVCPIAHLCIWQCLPRWLISDGQCPPTVSLSTLKWESGRRLFRVKLGHLPSGRGSTGSWNCALCCAIGRRSWASVGDPTVGTVFFEGAVVVVARVLSETCLEFLLPPLAAAATVCFFPFFLPLVTLSLGKLPLLALSNAWYASDIFAWRVIPSDGLLLVIVGCCWLSILLQLHLIFQIRKVRGLGWAGACGLKQQGIWNFLKVVGTVVCRIVMFPTLRAW